MDDLDDAIVRAKALIAAREAIYNDLAALLGQPFVARRTLICSICHSSAHTAGTCPHKPQE